MRGMRGMRTWGLLCASLVAGIAPLHAQDEPEEAARTAPPPWRVTVSTYGWLAGFSGTSRPLAQAPTISFDKSFGDVWEHLDASLFLSVMARRDRFVAMGDYAYTSSSADGRIAALPGLQARGGFSQATGLALAGYRVLEHEQQALDVYAGLRWWHVRSHVAADVGGQAMLSLQDRFWWLDPVLATRYRQAVARGGEVLLYGDIGGFGLGADLSWQLMALYNQRIAERWLLSAGYRVLSTDYRADGHLHDVRIAGPLLGISYRF
jgi:hypothetical protein